MTQGFNRFAKTAGITGAIAAPLAIYNHKDAYKYYNDMEKDKGLPGEQRQLANAMKTKEMLQMLAEGPGTAMGTSMGSLVTKHPKLSAVLGGAIPNALSRGIGWAFDKGLQPAMERYNFPVYQNDKKSLGELMPPADLPSGMETIGIAPQQSVQPRTSRGITGMAAPTVEDQVKEMLSATPKSNGGSGEQTDAEKLQAINDYVARLQEVNRPYTEALNNYISNYNDLAKGNFNAQRYFTAMAGLAKNPGYVKLADALNPLNNEANRINAMKMVRDAEAGNVNAINEMMGNLAMAEELGLPPEAAFANKNLLTAMSMQNRDNTKLEIALANNLMKKYGIDKNYARAIAQQQLRNQGSLAVANTYMSGGGGGAAPGLNARGGAQTSYKSPVNNQDPRAQFFK